jgi:hypothetical protein
MKLILLVLACSFAANVVFTFTVANGTKASSECKVTGKSTIDAGNGHASAGIVSWGAWSTGVTATAWPTADQAAVGIAVTGASDGATNAPASCAAGYITLSKTSATTAPTDKSSSGTITCAMATVTGTASSTNWGVTINGKLSEAATLFGTEFKSTTTKISSYWEKTAAASKTFKDAFAAAPHITSATIDASTCNAAKTAAAASDSSSFLVGSVLAAAGVASFF